MYLLPALQVALYHAFFAFTNVYETLNSEREYTRFHLALQKYPFTILSLYLKEFLKL
jgi:hypothetical protein